MKNIKLKLLIFCFFSVTVALFSSCGPGKKEKEEQAQTVKDENQLDTPGIVPVRIIKGKLTSTIAVPGELLPYQQVELFAKISSYVKKLYVDIGSEVHKGQLLVTLEAPEINSQLLAAKARIKQQEAVYYASKAMYDRLVSTSKTPGTISANDLEQAAAKKNSDLANVEAARSSYDEVAANLAYLEIKAPIDGIISVRNINIGDYVGPGGKTTDPLFILQDQNRMRLVISVPENFTGGLSDKDRVTFSVKSLPNRKFTAQVKRLAGAIDEKLRSERLEMDVYNKDKALLPHMFAEVDVPLPAQDSTLIVPKTAVVTSTEKVFVIRIANKKAEWVDVKKGTQTGDLMVIYGKLQPGDSVVQKGSEEIRDGSPVREVSGKAGQAEQDSTKTNNRKQGSSKK